jgi:hypothetical protein
LNYTCTITLNLDLELAYFALSLFFGMKYPPIITVAHASFRSPDLAAFVVIVVFALRSTPRFSGLRNHLLPRIVRTVVRDATLYFGVMFTSQFILMAFQAFARVRFSAFGRILILTVVIIGWYKNDPRAVS